MIRFIPAAAMLMLSGLAMAGNSVSSMFGNSATPMCETRDMPNIFNAVYAMQEYGALPDKNYDKNLKNIKVRTIGLGKIGFRPLAGPPESEAGSYADPAHPSTLYSVVHEIEVKGVRFLSISEQATDGCIWSNPMVIQTAPKLKVISLGESYSQSLIHIQQGGHAGQVIENLLGEK